MCGIVEYTFTSKWVIWKVQGCLSAVVLDMTIELGHSWFLCLEKGFKLLLISDIPVKSEESQCIFTVIITSSHLWFFPSILLLFRKQTEQQMHGLKKDPYFRDQVPTLAFSISFKNAFCEHLGKSMRTQPPSTCMSLICSGTSPVFSPGKYSHTKHKQISWEESNCVHNFFSIPFLTDFTLFLDYSHH